MAAYQPMQNPVPDWSDIGAMLLRARQGQKESESKRAELLLRQQNSERENARLDEQMRHTTELENHTRQVDVANVLPKIKAMLTPGDPSYDPETGMSMARAFDINLSAAQPTAPTAPDKPTLQAQPANPMFGPKMPQSLVDEADSPGRAAVENEKFFDFDRADANKAAMGKFASQQADYQKQLAHPRAPTYSGTSPVGQISIDPNAAVAAREERLRQQQEQMNPLTGAVDDEFRPVVQAMIQAGMPASEVAKTIAERQKERHQDATKADYNLTAEDQRRHQKEMERIGWAAANSRGSEQRDRSADKFDTTVVRDEKGQPIGYVPTGKGGAQGFATRDADYSRGEQMLQGLLTDIEQNGSRVVSPEAVQRRASLHKNAIIGVATVSPLGKTDEAQKLEAASIGPSGAPDMENKTGLLMGANPEAIRRKLDELRSQRERYRAQTLIPMSERPERTTSSDRRPPPRQSTQNEQRADTLKSGGKRKSLDDLAAEHGL